MVLNYIFVSFFLIAFAIGLFRLIVMGDVDVFPAMMNSTFDSAKTSFEISLGLTGVLSLWLGIRRAEWSTLSPACCRQCSANSSPTYPRGIPSRAAYS